jgi:hypothetical protein
MKFDNQINTSRQTDHEKEPSADLQKQSNRKAVHNAVEPIQTIRAGLHLADTAAGKDQSRQAVQSDNGLFYA